MAYLLFSGNDDYPKGVADYLQGKFDTIEAAVAAHDLTAFEYDGDWANVLCLDTLKVVKEFYAGTWR